MTSCKTNEIRDFILRRYQSQLASRNSKAEDVTDNFDLLAEGVIDSLGVLELISAIEEEFQVQIDLEGMDAEKLTVVGPLSTYIEKTARPR
jgi:acyl carrier protein